MITQEQVLKALHTVDDPDLKRDLVTLGMVQNLTIENNRIKFSVMLTTPACPLKELIHNNCLNAIKTLVSPDAEIEIEMTSKVTSTRDGSAMLAGVKNIIAVASGKGGVGKSTVAVNLAIGLARDGASVGLLDADIYGPSVPILLNTQHLKPAIEIVNGQNKILPIERLGIKTLSLGNLIPADQAVVWRGPMASNALRQLIGDTLWGELDYMILDLPPGTGDIQLTLAQQLSLTGAVIVTTPQKVAVADARKGLAMFVAPQINVPVLGIVENMSYFIPPEDPNKRYFIFGQGGGNQLSQEFNIPILAQVPIEEAVQADGDEGIPIVLDASSPAGLVFRRLSAAVAQAVAIRNAEKVISPQV